MVLIKIDATNLFERISSRKKDYMETFSLKRDRDVFKEIFKCRYTRSTFFDLSHLPTEIIEVANDFYDQVDKLYWYLMHTQDMPNTIEDEIMRYLHFIERKFEALLLYVDAELSGTNLEDSSDFEDVPAQNPEEEYFHFTGETENDSES